MTRNNLCYSLLAISAIFLTVMAADKIYKPDKNEDNSGLVVVRLLDANDKLGEPTKVKKVSKTDEEWQKLLTAEQYKIARGKGTEPPFCGVFYDNKKSGIYCCVCCQLPLFSSDAKFDSGTGWPSFLKPIAEENVKTHPDLSHNMVRTEILCVRCDAHLGHVFNDGPPPTGKRYCVNSVSLDFKDIK